MKERGSSKNKTLKLEGLIPVLEEYTKSFDVMVDNVNEFLSKKGIKLAEQPMVNGEPLIPRISWNPDGRPSLEPLDLAALSNLYAECNAYWAYIDALLGSLLAEKLIMEEKLDDLEAQIKVRLPPPEASKKDRVKVDPRYRKLRMELAETRIKVINLSKVVSSFEGSIKFISRELSLRIAEMDKIRREENAFNRMNKAGRIGNGISGGKRVK